MSEIISNEEWRIVKSFPMYEVSNLGRVRSLHKNIILKKINHYRGYDIVFLYADEVKNKKCFVHRLVAEAFLENPQSKPFVNHIDCNKKNNTLVNLEYMTEAENTQYYYKTRDLNENSTPDKAPF